MDKSGAPLVVSLSCDINTGKNQSDCTNCLKCLRICYIVRQNAQLHFLRYHAPFTTYFQVVIGKDGRSIYFDSGNSAGYYLLKFVCDLRIRTPGLITRNGIVHFLGVTSRVSICSSYIM